MTTHDLAINAAYDALVDTYTKIFGKMWVNTVGPAMDFEIANDGQQEVIRSKDGFVELLAEQTTVIGREAWKYSVYPVFDDDIGETFTTHYPEPAAKKFMELHLSMRLACMHNLPAER